MLPDRTYPAKLLLLGEYSVVLGSEALAVPYPAKGGKWGQATESTPSILPFLDYLSDKIDPGEEQYRTDKLRKALSEGWHFQSDIPIGYGLGSSGALTAAVYDVCRVQPPEDPEQLQSELASLESFFHGSSSGMDPLVSYLQVGVHRRDKEIFDLLQAEALPQIPGLYLIDTAISRETAPLVEAFLKRCEDSSYRSRVENELAPEVTAGIRACLNFDWNTFRAHWARISKLQLELFRPMIPEDQLPVWERGIASGEYYMKLCGAGGGGYLLGLRMENK